MKEAENYAQVAFAETGTLPYLVRKHAADQIVVSGYATRLPTGVFPSQLSERAFQILQQAYPSIEPLENSLSGALMNAGPVIHPPLILMNAGALEYFETRDIHNEGTQQSIRRVTTQLDTERIQVREALGYSAPHFPLADHYNKEGEGDEWMYGRGAHGKLTDSGDWHEDIDLHTHRYMLEDTKLGLSFLVSVGRWAGVPTPVAEGLLNLASAVTGENFYQTGRTLENLQLAQKAVRKCLPFYSREPDMQLIKQIAVVGAGRMGKAISIAFAYAGLNIQLIDARERDPEEFHIYRQKIISDISQELQLLVSINFIQETYVETILKRIEVTSRNKSQNF